jgi:cysteine synthase
LDPFLEDGTILISESVVRHFQRLGLRLPTLSELVEPASIPAEVQEQLRGIDPDAPHPLNLYRVHWHNSEDRRGLAPVPLFLELPSSLTGVPARIVLLLGDRFPMIRAHKVLAAYACLVPRLLDGQFDPQSHRAVWPSTGNYCRGGVAISRILGCRGVAVLPEGMSRERFQWLESWVSHPEDIVRTPGTESNVKEIYDRCAELEKDPANVILNQFQELGNYLAHHQVTGPSAKRVFDSLAEATPKLRLAAWVSATGSAGTLAAGDYLKHELGSRVVAAEALECPTLLYNGFGEHNIQGIGDKHVPFIHNVMGTDLVTAISDRATDSLYTLFQSPEGRAFLSRRTELSQETAAGLDHLGFSGICNLLAAIKTARYLDLDENDVILTVATDGAELYHSEHRMILERDFPQGFGEVEAAEVYGCYLRGAATDHLLELSHQDRKRIFNLGYFTWVEQQRVSVEEFNARREPGFWTGLVDQVPAWDEGIRELNRRSGAAVAV